MDLITLTSRNHEVTRGGGVVISSHVRGYDEVMYEDHNA